MERKEKENDSNMKMKIKTVLCRRFSEGLCVLGYKCNYAHGVSELRRRPIEPKPKLCRLFLQNQHCPYGRTCRFLHSSPFPPLYPKTFPIPNAPVSENAELKKHDADSCFEYKIMQNSSVATMDGYSCPEYRTMEASTAATNSPSPSSLNENEPYGVKCMFKNNELQKISRIYADWI